MAYSILNFVEADVTATNQTVVTAPNFTASSASALVAFVWYDAAGAGPTTTCTLSDTVGSNDSWTEIGEATVSGDYRFRSYYLLNAASGSCTVRATFSDVTNYPTLAVAEISGIVTSSALVGNAANSQASPGTSTDAVTSGNTSALTSQPAAVLAMVQNTNSDATPAAGTGYTSQDSYRAWDYGGTFGGRFEHKRVTATTAVAGTFTTASGTVLHQTIVVALAEAGGAPASITKQAAAYYRMMRNR